LTFEDILTGPKWEKKGHWGVGKKKKGGKMGKSCRNLKKGKSIKGIKKKMGHESSK